MTPDPFATAELRRRVLSAWRESPARFRADANTEDDLALVGYRDRVIVELAQNAADAATRAGVPGRLILDLTDGVLTAANNGAPLDAAGVESISVARASAKVDQPGTVGRFGVGFAAVLAVSDEPAVVSSLGAVRWSRPDALAAAGAIPELAGQLGNRGDRIPVLRLPFAADLPLEMDADTAVVLPLRDAAAIASVRSQLERLDPTLLLALPGLGEIVVRVDGSERAVTATRHQDVMLLHDGDTTTRWQVTTAAGTLPAELLADLPTEDRRADTWRVTWALPIDEVGRLVALPDSVARVVRAPTSVDDPLTLPAVLIASYPLDASRRRVTDGPLAATITDHAAAALVAALATLPPDPSMLQLVPTGFTDGPIDGSLRSGVLERMHDTAWLPVAGDPERRQRPRDAIVVPDELVGPLVGVVAALLPAGWARPALNALGVRRPEIADIIEFLANATGDPTWWRSLYAALDQAVAPGPERDALGALPVPLTDGTTVTGPRGLVLPGEELPAVDLSALDLRLVAVEAVHPLLAALGAVEGTPRGLLDLPNVQAAVEASYDEADPEPIAVAVLSLVAAAGAASDELPWLSELALLDAEGEWRSAGELLLPDGLMAGLVVADSGFGIVAAGWVDRWGSSTLAAVGVLDGPAILRAEAVTEPSHDLDDEESWWATLPADATVDELVAVRDLEQIRPEALAGLTATLASPPWRSAIVEPAILALPDGGRRLVPSYTAWWLSSRPVVAGRVPRDLRLASSEPILAALYDVAPAGLDGEFLRAIGVLGTLADADPDDVLARLADPDRDVTRAQLRSLNSWLADQDVTPPDHVRAIRDDSTVVVAADDVVVVDAPDLLPLLGGLAVVPVPLTRAEALAERLDLPLASDVADFAVVSEGDVVDDAVVHENLLVRNADGDELQVTWRLIDETLHVDAGQLAFGLGRGRAWRDGEWDQRHRRTEALINPDRGMIHNAEDDLDEDE